MSCLSIRAYLSKLRYNFSLSGRATLVWVTELGQRRSPEAVSVSALELLLLISWRILFERGSAPTDLRLWRCVFSSGPLSSGRTLIPHQSFCARRTLLKRLQTILCFLFPLKLESSTLSFLFLLNLRAICALTLQYWKKKRVQADILRADGRNGQIVMSRFGSA